MSMKDFTWSPAATKAFERWSQHKNAQIDDLPLRLLLQGTMIGNNLWNSVDCWWQRYPKHFGMFWATVQQQPRQPWSQSALRVLAKYVPVEEVEQLVQSALLCPHGRNWLLSSLDYAPYLHNMNNEQIREWVRATTYSMPNLFETFDSLGKLQACLNGSTRHNIVAETLAWQYHEQENLAPNNNVAKAWRLNTTDLNRWMDEDKQLPFWFDPVNRCNWRSECIQWIQQTGYVLHKDHPLFACVQKNSTDYSAPSSTQNA